LAKKRVVAITLPENVLKAIDEVRGPISRSSFILWLIEEGLKASGRKTVKT